MEKNNQQLFFDWLDGSERTVLNYKNAINSTYLKTVLKTMFDTSNLFDLSDLVQLWQMYSFVKQDDNNVRNHRIYSSAIMKYMRFQIMV